MVQVWSVHMHFDVKGFKMITLHSNFQTYLQPFTNKTTWNWPFRIEYENNMMSHYIEEVHAIKWCTKTPYIMHIIIISNSKGKALRFWVDFQVSKFLAQSTIFIGRPHDDTRVNGSNVSNFNRLLRSLFTQLCLENPRSHIVVLAKPKLQSVPSRSCRVIGIWKRLPRVPRVESNYVSIHTLQPMYVVTRNSWRGLHCEGRKLCRAHFCEVPQKPIFFWRPEWLLTGVEDFNIEHCLLPSVEGWLRPWSNTCPFLSSPSLVPPLLCWRLPEVLLLIIPSTGTNDALMLLSTLGLLHLKLWFTIWSYMLLRSFLRRVDNGVDDVVVYVVDDVQCLMLPNNEWTGRTNL